MKPIHVFSILIPSLSANTDCSCAIQAMQDSVSAISLDLKSRGFDTGPINDLMNAMDDMMPMIMTEMKAQGISDPDELMTELGMSSTDIASTIDDLYKQYSDVLEMKEVKNLWNAGVKAGEKSYDIMSKAFDDGIDAMQPEFNKIWESMGWLESSSSRKKRDVSDQDVENMVRNLHKVLTKLFNNYLTADMVQDYTLDIFKQIKTVANEIDALISKPEFMNMFGGMKRKRRAVSQADIDEYNKYSELFNQQAALFAGELANANDTWQAMYSYVGEMYVSTVFDPVIQGLISNFTAQQSTLENIMTVA